MHNEPYDAVYHVSVHGFYRTCRTICRFWSFSNTEHKAKSSHRFKLNVVDDLSPASHPTLEFSAKLLVCL